jgi:hypothetical protein
MRRRVGAATVQLHSLEQADLLLWRIGRTRTAFWPCVRYQDPTSLGLCGMDWPDYLRDQAAMYRQLAERADDPVVKAELLELVSVCEEVANNIEDHLTGG